MVLVDYSSIMMRMVAGSMESLIHVTSVNHGLQTKNIGNRLHCNYKEVGEVSHIFDENTFTFILNYGTKYEDVKSIMEYPQAKLEKATKVKDIKYPLSSFIKVFNNVFFNNINGLHTKFGSTFGDMVFCLDNPTHKGYWRTRFLPSYKGTRKASKDKSAIDFVSLFKYVNDILLPILGEHTPAMVVDYPRAEGDDVISVLTNKYKDKEKICIISEDKDLKALVDDNVVFYRPMLDRYAERLSEQEREEYILLHSILGDVSDNVQNATLNTKYSPEFLKWLKEKTNIELNEYDIDYISSNIVIHRPYIKSLFKKYFENIKNNNPEVVLTQELFDSIIKSEEFINNYKEDSKFNLLGIYKNENDLYCEFIKEKHPNKYIETLDGKGETISSKVFKHYWYGEKTIQEKLLPNFDTSILENPNWYKRYKLNRKLVDPFKVPKYIAKGIISNFEETLTRNDGNYNAFKQFLNECQVNNADLICDNFFPQNMKLVEW